MNNRMIEDFSHRYGARVRYQSKALYEYGYSKYDDRPDTVEVDLTYRALEHLVEADYRAELDYRASREEAHMRKKYPALEEAYSKYQMLMELYK
jgi:hypothetical protein